MIVDVGYFAPQHQRQLTIVLLPFPPGFVHKLDEPLHDGEDVVHIESLQLKGLQIVRAFHPDKGVADDLRRLDLLSNLHLVVVLHIDGEVGGGDAPGHAAQHLVEGPQGRNPDPEVAGHQQDLVNFVEARVVLRVPLDDLGHIYLILAQRP